MPAGQKYWIEEDTLDTVIQNDDVDRDGKYDHAFFTIRNHCLHAKHPLGWIRAFKLSVDGREIPGEQAYLVLRGQWISLKHLPTITDIWWNVAEEAKVYFKAEGGLAPGGYAVKCEIYISLHVNTRTVDIENVWPCLTVTLESAMRLD